MLRKKKKTLWQRTTDNKREEKNKEALWDRLFFLQKHTACGSPDIEKGNAEVIFFQAQWSMHNLNIFVYLNEDESTYCIKTK
jgi:hypothetical protein